MKSAVETLSPTRAKLTVEVPFEELKPSLDAAYQQIAKQINVPGFRRGKVPPAVIDRQVGREAVLDQAINDLLPQKYMEALQSNSLEPLAQPEIEVTKHGEEGLEFTAEVDVKPEITLPAYDGLEATVDDIEISDADVEEQVQALRERFATLSDVERPAADGDFVVMDLTATRDGEVVDGAELTGMSYQVGRGGMIDGLDEALAGMGAGEEKTFETELVGGDLVGQPVEVRVKVDQVQEQELPELDDDFAQEASEFDTVAELSDDVRERLGRGKRLEQAAAARDAVLEALLEKMEVPLPESIVTDELNARRQSIEQQLVYSGMPMDAYLEEQGQTLEEFEADLERRVRDAVAAQFVLDAIAKKEALGVDQNELTQLMVRRAQQSGQDPQEFANHMFEHNHIPELVQEILRGKALAQLVEAATVTDESGNPVELKNLLPDGTIGEPRGRGRAPSVGDTERPTTRRRRGATPRTTPTRPTAATPTSKPRSDSAGRRGGHARGGECTTVHRRPRLGDMAQVATPGPTVLDALSLLAEVGDELLVRTVRDTHLAVLDRTSAGPVHRGIATAVYRGPHRGAERRRLGARPGGRDRASGRGSRPDPRGRFVSSAVNGLIGDRLLRERPQLAIPMAVRLHGADVEPEPEPLAEAFPEATGQLVVFLHGLCENESYWNHHRDRTGTTYAAMLAERGWTPLMLRANTGLPLRENGAALTALLQRVVEAWPVPVTRIALVGHSLGGLVMRAAGAVASEVEEPWSRRGHRRDHAGDAAPRSADRLGDRPRQPRARSSSRRPRRSAGSSTGARAACTTWSRGSPRTCRRCRTRATTWSPQR